MEPTTVDLSRVAVVDNHCHPVWRDQRITEVSVWRAHFTEGRGPATASRHVATTVAYQEAIRAIAAHLGCPSDEAAILGARPAQALDGLLRGYWEDARLGGLIVDDGFPPPGLGIDAEELGAGLCPVGRVRRLETLFEDLIVGQRTIGAVRAALRDRLQEDRAGGWVGLKSIAAYRGGLRIRRWPEDEVETAFREARTQVARGEGFRLTDRRLRDALLHEAFAFAARTAWPVQFHCGYGDTDSDLLHANPLRLRAVLEEPAYAGLPVVLLHEAYPYTREAAYLCAVYDQVHLDLSFAAPFLAAAEMAAVTTAALGVAPWSKLLYASDGVGIPELHWLGAHRGRRVLGACLGGLVDLGSLDGGAAEAAGEAILAGNARRLYGLAPLP
ncbi:MAG TPA: amidohydrolase family protein [Candidatus Micrarchaeia archaeon]|nr:amidohydrolase family protein [Candidatus Micrarchaeia archaeon]